jgi:hypothetical protein
MPQFSESCFIKRLREYIGKLVSSLSLPTQSLRPETESLWPNSGQASDLSDFEACQGETPSPESPASRARVSGLEDALAAFRGSPLHHFHLREAPYKTTKP